jgi:hypothetical protein
MVFVLLGLAVYMATKVLREWIIVPKWALLLAIVGMSALGLFIARENAGWCLAVAAISGFAYRLDGLLGALRDWFRIQVLRGPTRR